MSTEKITLTENQLNKLRRAYKRHDLVNVRLQHNQLTNGKHIILLTESQHKKLIKARMTNKGVELNISYQQLQSNHTGGFLPLVFAGLGALGALLGGGASIATSIVNAKNKGEELAELKRHNRSIEDLEAGVSRMNVGSGLKKGRKKVSKR